MLEPVLDVTVTEDAVEFDFSVANPGDEDVELSFSDSQRVRVSVYSADATDGATEEAEPSWRSDDGQMFVQALGSETVPASGRIEFHEVWTEPKAGAYRAVGEVVCRERDLQDENTFTV